MRIFITALFLSVLTACTQQATLGPEHHVYSEVTASGLLSEARTSISSIPEAGDRVDAMLDLALALYDIEDKVAASELIDQALTLSSEAASVADRDALQLKILATASEIHYPHALHTALPSLTASIQAANVAQPDWSHYQMLAVLIAKAGDYDRAVDLANRIPDSSFDSLALRAKALTGISTTVARSGDLVVAERILESVTKGLPYYRAIAYANLAVASNVEEKDARQNKFFEQAVSLAKGQTNNYYVAGATRTVASRYVAVGLLEQAKPLYHYAMDAATHAGSPQEAARALSRIMSSLADSQLTSELKSIPLQAVAIAESETNDVYRYWAYYELAGSLAQLGMNELALDLAGRIPSELIFAGRNLRSATLRDVAWGFAQNQQLDSAMAVTKTIPQLREKAQALSRIARVVNNASMHSLPRYL